MLCRSLCTRVDFAASSLLRSSSLVFDFGASRKIEFLPRFLISFDRANAACRHKKGPKIFLGGLTSFGVEVGKKPVFEKNS
jgi:hypothetical protein